MAFHWLLFPLLLLHLTATGGGSERVVSTAPSTFEAVHLHELYHLQVTCQYRPPRNAFASCFGDDEVFILKIDQLERLYYCPRRQLRLPNTKLDDTVEVVESDRHSSFTVSIAFSRADANKYLELYTLNGSLFNRGPVLFSGRIQLQSPMQPLQLQRQPDFVLALEQQNVTFTCSTPDAGMPRRQLKIEFPSSAQLVEEVTHINGTGTSVTTTFRIGSQSASGVQTVAVSCFASDFSQRVDDLVDIAYRPSFVQLAITHENERTQFITAQVAENPADDTGLPPPRGTRQKLALYPGSRVACSVGDKVSANVDWLVQTPRSLEELLARERFHEVVHIANMGRLESDVVATMQISSTNVSDWLPITGSEFHFTAQCELFTRYFGKSHAVWSFVVRPRPKGILAELFHPTPFRLVFLIILLILIVILLITIGFIFKLCVHCSLPAKFNCAHFCCCCFWSRPLKADMTPRFSMKPTLVMTFPEPSLPSSKLSSGLGSEESTPEKEQLASVYDHNGDPVPVEV